MTRALLAALLLSATAAADPVLLRMATIAPPGTGWAREGTAFERDIDELTHGQVKMKWYLGGIAGDEQEMLERLRKDQLDGVASGGMMCMKLAPSMRVLRVVGLFQSRAESAYVSGRLRDTLDKEFLQAGFVNLGELGVGADIIFSRQPIRSMAELKSAKIWIWDLDDIYGQELPAMGLNVVPTPIYGAFKTYDRGDVDGFLAVPTAALAFQWSTEARHFQDLRASFLRGCLLITSRSYDALSVEGQHAVKVSAARTIARLEELGQRQDDALLGGLFARQGLTPVPVSDQFRAEFFEAARAMRDRLGEKLVARPLLQRVLGMLADYRAEHRSASGR